jgi:hypothetical protein
MWLSWGPNVSIEAFVVTFYKLLLENGTLIFSLPRWQAPRPRKAAAAPCLWLYVKFKAVGLNPVTPCLILHLLSCFPVSLGVRGWGEVERKLGEKNMVMGQEPDH